MPHKDPLVAKACKRAHYLANPEKFRVYIVRRKVRRLELAVEKKKLKELQPIVVPQRACQDCKVDITENYNPKWGCRCKPCVAVYHRAYRVANKDRIAQLKKQWATDNAAHKAEQDRQYALNHPEKRAQARHKWRDMNPGLDNALKMRNKIERKKRVPAWLTEDDHWMIEQAYDLAALRTKMFGVAWHVDHVIPLCGKKVSGLHVPYNLQVILGSENCRKGNRV
jgi:hypothetical protein